MDSDQNIRKTMNRAGVILSILYFLFAALFGASILVLIKTGILQDMVVKPLVYYVKAQFKPDPYFKFTLPSPSAVPSSTEPATSKSGTQPVTNKNPATSTNVTPKNTEINVTHVRDDFDYDIPEPEPKCYDLEIDEGEFKSDKCYSWDDYVDLRGYLADLRTAELKLHSAESRIDMTCDCDTEQQCEFFKDSCEDAKEDKADAEDDIDRLEGKIETLISRGK